MGINGRNVAAAVSTSGIPHVIIEMNPETVRIEQARGQPVIYGDAANEAVLEHAGIRTAEVVVITIPDPAATQRITVISMCSPCKP